MMTPHFRFPFAIAGLVFAFALTGCEQGPPMGEVTGKITIDGKAPPTGASITFMPTDGGRPTAGTMVNDDGTYTVLVPVGSTKVEIRAPKTWKNRAPKQQEGPGSEAPDSGDLMVEWLPPKYNNNTELTLDVVEGKNPKDWELKLK